MRIERLEVVRVGGALSGVAANRRTTWRERAGLRLAVFDERGRVGLGEASPLPGYSPETIDDAEAALAIDVATLNAALAVLRGDGGLEEERDAVVREGGRVIGAAAARLVGPVPSARFALETALLDLVGQRAGVPIHAMLGAPPPAAVPVSALVVSRSPDGAADEARRAVARGMRTLKLKLGLGSLDDERALLRAVRAAVPADVALRLDANGQAALPPRELLDAV
ncbi:mandelate racemase/muconate lactonizing enzyme family protein, partial [Myxococcota bacterium]|nr:mandelate racemase/muconate lactonizing enzyme family protein [Myxococcota bacterium]